MLNAERRRMLTPFPSTGTLIFLKLYFLKKKKSVTNSGKVSQNEKTLLLPSPKCVTEIRNVSQKPEKCHKLKNEYSRKVSQNAEKRHKTRKSVTKPKIRIPEKCHENRKCVTEYRKVSQTMERTRNPCPIRSTLWGLPGKMHYPVWFRFQKKRPELRIDTLFLSRNGWSVCDNT